MPIRPDLRPVHHAVQPPGLHAAVAGPDMDGVQRLLHRRCMLQLQLEQLDDAAVLRNVGSPQGGRHPLHDLHGRGHQHHLLHVHQVGHCHGRPVQRADQRQGLHEPRMVGRPQRAQLRVRRRARKRPVHNLRLGHSGRQREDSLRQRRPQRRLLHGLHIRQPVRPPRRHRQRGQPQRLRRPLLHLGQHHRFRPGRDEPQHHRPEDRRPRPG